MLEWINANVFGIGVPCALVLVGLFFTLRVGLMCAAHPEKMLRGMLQRTGEGTSPFRALTLALAGTLGVGNLVGVASAIWYGGAGAVFWMWVSALVAMALKYAEVVLAVSHRRTDAAGNHRGGAMYYISDCFCKLGCARLGKVLAAVFAALCVLDGLSMGCVIQTNAISGVFSGICGIPPILTGAVLCVATLIIMLGGSARIMKATDLLVPVMTGGFMILSIAVLILRAPLIPSALRSVFSAVFDLRSALGGVGGFAVARALRYGAMRGLVSNEAGCGTAPIAHACANTDHPAKQGFWGIFEVFADTLVLCSTTAYVDAQFDRKKRNLICRRMRAYRRANLQPLNYFVTLTYDDQLHTEDSFRQRLKETLSRFASRKGWRYMGVWERGGNTDRLHFHGLFYIPEGTMPGTLEAVTDFDTRAKRMRTTLQSTYFNEHFGRSDFGELNPHTLRINLQYLLKYIEKSGEKIMYSRQMKQYLVSDIREDDVATPFGKEDRKLILFSNFTCIHEGKTVEPVSPEVIAKMPKTD